MAPLATAQAASSYLEKLRSTVPLLFERDDVLLGMFEKQGDMEVVSPRSMRISLKIRPGGKAGQFSADGGNLGRGSGTTRVEAIVSPIFFKFAVEVNKLVEYATNNKSKSIENVAKDEVKNGMAQFRAFLDKLLQTAGDGVLANITVLPGGNVFTLGTPYFQQLLYFGQTITVMKSDFTVNRGTAEITNYDPDNNQITVDATPGGTIVTDVIVPQGITGTGTPTSMFGLKYHHSNASSGTWLNLNRATYPEIRTPRVNALSAALVPGHVRLALNKIRKVLGINALQAIKLIAYMGLEQQHQWEQLAITVAEIIRKGSGDSQPDLLFSDTSTMGGAPIKTSVNADPTRIDFVALKNWIRAVIQPIDFYEQGGQTVFPVIATSGADAGGLVAAYLFYYVFGVQIANQNPRQGVFIDNLVKPTGY